ncbi:uncharacterized protein [Euwallacea similis]|uniref:uncharacterized protein isoform X2 n=1 Tax=Euwallacea similis TaxID=1736056 RepID=UPI00344EF78E
MNTLVRGLMTDSFCYICYESLLGASHNENHYSSIKHYQNIVTWMKGRLVAQNIINSRFIGVNLIHTPTVYNNLGSASPFPPLVQRAINLPAVEQLKLSNCYVCNLGFQMQSHKEAHVKEFPHCIMAPMKSEMIKRGLEVEFLTYSRRKKTLTCILCKVKMLNIQTASKHLNEESHIQTLNNWCAKFVMRDLPLEVTRYYYCKICNVFLDGTSDANQHYKEEPHRLRLAQTQRPSNLTLPSSNCVNFLHESPASAPKPVTVCQKSPKTMPNFKDIQLSDFISILASNKTNGESSECVSVKDQLFSEINKLVQTIYYSKTLPLEVSLQYVKKVNEDVKELVKNYQMQESDDVKSEDDVEHKDEISQENEAVENIKFVSETAETIDCTNKGNNFLSKNCQTAEQEAILPRQFDYNVESELVNEKPKTMVEMLLKVESEKSKLMETNPFALEINVLSEIENLLKQINQPKRIAEKILKYLKTFNKSLDQQKFILHEDERRRTSHESLKEPLSPDTHSNISPEMKNLLRNENVLIDSLNHEKEKGD